MYIWLISYNINLILIFKNHFKTSFFFKLSFCMAKCGTSQLKQKQRMEEILSWKTCKKHTYSVNSKYFKEKTAF